MTSRTEQLEQAKQRIQELENMLAAQQTAASTQLGELQAQLTRAAEEARTAIAARDVLLRQQQQQQAAAAAATTTVAGQQPQDPPPPPFVLPSAVKPQMPDKFTGKMDGDTVAEFVAKLDAYFALVRLTDARAKAALAVTLLSDHAYTWFMSLGYSLEGTSAVTWPVLKSELLDQFKPVDYRFQARRQLARCRQTADVQSYVRQFRLCLVRCPEVADDEALFRFLDGLKFEEQRYVRLQQPASFSSAAAYAEQIGSTMRQVQPNHAHGKKNKPSTPFPHFNSRGNVREDNGVVPMELGSFNGRCFRCNKPGHRAADCKVPEHALPATRPARPQQRQNRPAKAKLNASVGVEQASSSQSAHVDLQQLANLVRSEVNNAAAQAPGGSSGQGSKN